MGFIELMAMIVLPYFVICRVGRKYPNVFALTSLVVIGVIATLAIGLFYVTQTFEAGHPFKEMAIRNVIGMGFWFSLFGSVAGAFHGRKWAKKDAAKLEMSDVEKQE